ncbi:hypothetical protein Tco_0823705 [Tanacetum coccineum]|uniref:Uncharacterized protein n=1 Tax=Tanacetum coccineum TaxID=301880 RepID=A0ABQ5AMP8_9ASTR
MSRSSSSLVANESAHYPYMISSSKEEPFEGLEYLQQAAMDQPSRPIGPRLDVPRNYGPGMNYQELERMHQLTTVSQDHMSRLDLHSQAIQDVLNRVERIDHLVKRD